MYTNRPIKAHQHFFISVQLMTTDQKAVSQAQAAEEDGLIRGAMAILTMQGLQTQEVTRMLRVEQELGLLIGQAPEGFGLEWPPGV